MPLYTFKCPECGDTAEALLPMLDRDSSLAAPTCPHKLPGTSGLTAVPMRRVPDAPHGIVRNPAVPRRTRG